VRSPRNAFRAGAGGPRPRSGLGDMGSTPGSGERVEWPPRMADRGRTGRTRVTADDAGGRGTWRAPWLQAAVLVVLAVAPFAASLGGELVWDDRLLIEEEVRFHSPRFALEILGQDFFYDVEEIYRYGYYRPVVSLSYWLTWRIAGEAPAPYHATNLALHAAATLLLLLLLRGLAGGSGWAPFAGAALFAVHPVHAESVAWISGRTDLLAAVLVLASAVALVRACGDDGPRPGGWMGAAVTAAAVAPFAKEAALFWPLVPAAVAVAGPARSRRRWAASAAALVAGLAPYLALRVGVAGTLGPSTQWRAEQWPSVLLTVPQTFWRYLVELALPDGPEPYLQNPLVRSPLAPGVVLGLAAMAALVVGWWRWRRRRPAASFLAAFWLLSFLPIANLVRISGPEDMGAPMAERFLYLPSAAACALAGLGLAAVAARGGRLRTLVPVAAAAVVVVLAAMSAAATRPWLTERALFERMVEQAPDAPLPNLLLGTVDCRAARWQPCVSRLERALGMLPDRPTQLAVAVRSNLAGAYAATGRTDAARRLLEGLRGEYRPISSVEFNLGVVEMLEGDRGAARQRFDRALEINPWHRQALVRRARLRIAAGELEAAEKDVERYAGRYGHDPGSLVALALLRGRQGREQQAVDALRRAASEQDPEAMGLLGAWAASVGRWAESLEAYERLLAARPGDVAAVQGAAAAELRLGDRAGAVRRLEGWLAAQGAHPEVEALLAGIRGGDGPG